MTDRELLEKIEERYERMKWFEEREEENNAAFTAAMVKRGCDAILTMYILDGVIADGAYNRAVELNGKVTMRYRNNRVFNEHKYSKY